MKLSLSLIATISMALAGCTTTPATKQTSSCEQKDWYEIGRHDGAQGTTLDAVNKYREQCPAEFSSNIETMYTNGRNAGLIEYCAPENAHELGRMGLSYKYVCPSTTEPEFLAGYRRGEAARKLEIENQKIDHEIDLLLAQLNAGDTDQYRKRELASEIDSLRKERARNERQLND